MSAPDPQRGSVCPTCGELYDAGAAFCPRDGTPLIRDEASRSSSLVGTVLADRYRIARKIGEGGMGQVFEADHVYLDRKVALKLLRTEITGDPEAVARFHQEARAASRIGHENIINVEDFGRLPDGSVYLVMEFLEGESLADRLRHPPPVPLDEAIDYALQACAGLTAAHDKGIIHRDMKPENVFLVPRSGRVLCKILDFGIAKVSGADGEKRLTRTGAVFGTPHYMSPEQALGKQLDHRSDVYSFGVILYELLTGRLPFEAENLLGILTQHLNTPPAPPTQVAPDRGIPPAVEAVVLRAMAKRPEDRYQSMAELALDLHAAAGLSSSVGAATLPIGSSSALLPYPRPATVPPPKASTVPPQAARPSTVPPAQAPLAEAVAPQAARPSTVPPASASPGVLDTLLPAMGPGTHETPIAPPPTGGQAAVAPPRDALPTPAEDAAQDAPRAPTGGRPVGIGLDDTVDQGAPSPEGGRRWMTPLIVGLSLLVAGAAAGVTVWQVLRRTATPPGATARPIPPPPGVTPTAPPPPEARAPTVVEPRKPAVVEPRKPAAVEPRKPAAVEPPKPAPIAVDADADDDAPAKPRRPGRKPIKGPQRPLAVPAPKERPVVRPPVQPTKKLEIRDPYAN